MESAGSDALDEKSRMTDCTDSPYTWPRTDDGHTIRPSWLFILAHPGLVPWYRITSACIVYDSSLWCCCVVVDELLEVELGVFDVGDDCKLAVFEVISGPSPLHVLIADYIPSSDVYPKPIVPLPRELRMTLTESWLTSFWSTGLVCY